MQQLTVGDHVIVDEGSKVWHNLVVGLDGKVVQTHSDDVKVESLSHRGGVIAQWVHPDELIKVDDLVTRPEGKFNVGDRVLITGDSGNAGHYLALADARIIEALDDDREYFVTGLDNQGDVNSWYVNERDLEAEPTFTKYVSFSMPTEYAALKREVDKHCARLASRVASQYAPRYYAPTRSPFDAPTSAASRERALRVAFDLTEPYDDVKIARIIDLAEYLLSGKVPA